MSAVLAPTNDGRATAPAPERPLRIALLGYRSNPFSGGQGVYLHYLSAALTALGRKVDVISGEPYPELEPGVGLIKLPGLNLFAADNHVTALRPRHLRSATDTFEWWSMLTGGFPEPYTFCRRLYRYLAPRLGQYDLVHDNQSLGSGLLDLQKAGMPVVATVHHPITWDRDIALAHAASWSERALIRRWHGFLRMQARVAQRLEHLVTVSENSRRDIAAAFGLAPSRIHVVPNGIDTQRFRPLPGVQRAPWRIDSVPGWAQGFVILAAVAAVIVVGPLPAHPVAALGRLAAGARGADGDRTVALVVGIALLMNAVGLSPALGTSVAGVMLASSEFRHELESDIEPFKALLLAVFFIAVGAGIDFALIADQPGTIGLMVLLLITIKGAVLYGLARAFGMAFDQRLLFAAALAQGGEFALRPERVRGRQRRHRHGSGRAGDRRRPRSRWPWRRPCCW